MNERGKSDGPVVPANLLNKAAAAEAGEERRPAKGNTDGETRPGRSAGPGVSSGLDRVREVARRDKDARFTALLHHVSLERLRWAYWALSPKAAPGVDGVTWEDYGKDLEANLRDLHERVQGGRYRAKPSRRAYIPKADGRLRPLGIAALEDKVVQRAVVEVLNAVYEVDFLGFSYGFRPGRSPHQALDALTAGIYRKKVNWVLDADIRDFFGQLDRAWLQKFLGHRIMQLHRLDVGHHHGTIADPQQPVGNGLALWFEAADFDGAVRRIRAVSAQIVTDVHVNPNAGHREVWIRDLDGYLVVFAEPYDPAPAQQ